ncbi:GAF domain-containing protein [Herbiconiux ginsengi]|uniref:GAF domain-containing protein n=1 Tax=Herbiconiux ginsengi TaxID=381665 RepID=A0A1H3KDF0_9MICO|nr:GAF domain-containing protein [Herbiconiux ginsengi]SDY49628.1 GAF domain-containing protein [Herbiconiux ginsengi]
MRGPPRAERPTIDDDWCTTMTSPWLAHPGDRAPARPRRVVHESWERARRRELDPEHLLPLLEVAEDSLADFRLAHPLAPVLPVIRKLLVRDAEGSGLLVAVGDEMGRLLWVEGDDAAKRRAEEMRFVAGAGWSERQVGTSAPGTALELDHGIQIHDEEHFNRLVHGWSCTAVPVHDPETRRILGVIDITGDARAVDPHTLPLIEATAAAAEAELMVLRLKALRGGATEPRMRVAGFASTARPGASGSAAYPDVRPARPARPRPVSMHVLGRDTGELTSPSGTLELSTRHSEIVTVLAWHREGLSAARLADLVYGDADATVTLRAEIVRLRRILASVGSGDPGSGAGSGLGLESRPYRLSVPVELDAHHVISLLDRGAHRVALAASRGPLLPGSEAPGVVEIRDTVRRRLREAMLTDAAIDVLLDYAATEDGRDDAEVLTAALRLLPPRSPKRAGVVAQLESLC